jgi:hypothetical protein
MRTALFLFALAFLWVAACTATTSPDEDCIVNGGICFTLQDNAGCATQLNFACHSGYQCCTNAFAANLNCPNGPGSCVLTDSGTGIPDNYGVDAAPPRDATLDSAHGDAEKDAPDSRDGARDVLSTDAARDTAPKRDASVVKDAGTTKDAAAMKDAGNVKDSGVMRDASGTTDTGGSKDGGTKDAGLGKDAGATKDAFAIDAKKG